MSLVYLAAALPFFCAGAAITLAVRWDVTQATMVDTWAATAAACSWLRP